MVPDKLKMVLNVVLASSIWRYFHQNFCERNLHFTCLFHTWSFPQVWPNLAGSVVTFLLALRCMCDSPQTRCVWRTTL